MPIHGSRGKRVLPVLDTQAKYTKLQKTLVLLSTASLGFCRCLLRFRARSKPKPKPPSNREVENEIATHSYPVDRLTISPTTQARITTSKTYVLPKKGRQKVTFLSRTLKKKGLDQGYSPFQQQRHASVHCQNDRSQKYFASKKLKSSPILVP